MDIKRNAQPAATQIACQLVHLHKRQGVLNDGNETFMSILVPFRGFEVIGSIYNKMSRWTEKRPTSRFR